MQKQQVQEDKAVKKILYLLFGEVYGLRWIWFWDKCLNMSSVFFYPPSQEMGPDEDVFFFPRNISVEALNR
jgi:hypothetical protein